MNKSTARPQLHTEWRHKNTDMNIFLSLRKHFTTWNVCLVPLLWRCTASLEPCHKRDSPAHACTCARRNVTPRRPLDCRVTINKNVFYLRERSCLWFLTLAPAVFVIMPLGLLQLYVHQLVTMLFITHFLCPHWSWNYKTIDESRKHSLLLWGSSAFVHLVRTESLLALDRASNLKMSTWYFLILMKRIIIFVHIMSWYKGANIFHNHLSWTNPQWTYI